MNGPYSVVVAPAARAQASKIADWWRAHRPSAPDLFADELEAAFVRVAATPKSIRIYRESKGRFVRRLLLPRTSYHLFFEVNDQKRQVNVLAVWHTARGRDPRL